MSDSAPVYRDPTQPVADRVEDLLARMSLDEKLAQLDCAWSTQLVEGEAFSERKAQGLLAHGAGQITRIGAATGLLITHHRVAADRGEAAQRALYDGALRLVVEPGEVEIAVGASSADLRSRGGFRITGKPPELRPAELAMGGAWSEP